nr:hypothetical protein BaRGS_033493 [Batillaria attramentaria]
MRQNLAVFSEQAAEAKRQVVDILVFPEDGIYGMGFTREALEPYLEYIPDPEHDHWIPCDDPNRYSYHKRHLFYEYQFDTPEAKVVSFDTPFGRWGMFTCFDILFYDPARSRGCSA